MRIAIVLLVLVAGCGSKSTLRVPDPSWYEMDAGFDAGRDGGADAGTDAGMDAGFDAGTDAGTDAGIDAGTDAGTDTGIDVGTDTGHDAAVDTSAGCADGEREAFRDRMRYPNIAGCGGGWTRPGIAHAAIPSCDHQGGDDGPFPNGGACGSSDLCAVGWHVCLGPSDVTTHSPDGCTGSHDAASAFFATRMSGPGCGVCATGSATDCTAVDCRFDCAQTAATMNDVFGCGTVGVAPEASTCGALDRFGNNLCGALPAPWSCTDDGSGTHEAELVVKPGPDHGGVLCCRD